MILWNVHSCFHWCKKYKNRPRNARVIVETNWFLFMEHRVQMNCLSYYEKSLHRCNLKTVAKACKWTIGAFQFPTAVYKHSIAQRVPSWTAILWSSFTHTLVFLGRLLYSFLLCILWQFRDMSYTCLFQIFKVGTSRLYDWWSATLRGRAQAVMVKTTVIMFSGYIHQEK